jgi:prefoldin subunit 5
MNDPKPTHSQQLNNLLAQYQSDLSELTGSRDLLENEIRKVKSLIKDVEKVIEKHNPIVVEQSVSRSVHYGH